MIVRELAASATPREFVLRSPPNWTAIIFFAALASLHLINAGAALLCGRWEGYLSLLFGTVFLIIALGWYRVRSEITIMPRPRTIGLRSGIGPFNLRRSIPFASVHAVRLTLCHGSRRTDSRIDILCDNEDLECPPTTIPRQQALYLAILLGVRLVKVISGNPPADQPQALSAELRGISSDRRQFLS